MASSNKTLSRKEDIHIQTTSQKVSKINAYKTLLPNIKITSDLVTDCKQRLEF
jgi:hypothetical protein